MAITVNRATLARQVNGEIEYIYPKTYADLVEYDSTQTVKEKIDSIVNGTGDASNKVNKPLNENGNLYDGEQGQVLETNGDGSTSWVTRARVYVGEGDIPEGYDVQINPNSGIVIEIDETLSIEGAVADAKAAGDAIRGITDDKVNKPLNENGNLYDGVMGQVLETNGDGSTSWVTRARVYVGEGEMPEGYDVQIDPTETAIEVDRTLSVDGAVAEASAVGAAINNTKAKITSEIETHNTDPASHIDIRAMITDAKDYILMRDAVTGEEVKVTVENGELVVKSTVIKPTSITITTAPTKTSYEVGEVFDPTGMVVTVNYDDGTSKVVTNYTYYPTTGLTGGMTSVAVTYIEAGVTVTTNVPITVVVKCIGISISTAPTITSYIEGQTFNPTGMIVAATYTDGTVKAVTNYTYPTTTLVLGTTTIPITYTEDGTTFTANVPITVSPGFDAVTVLQDFTYNTNSDGTYTITGWKGTLNGVPSTECVVPDSELIIVTPVN